MPTWMPTGRVRPDAPLLLSHVVLAEFDIDKGSTVRLQYPSDVPHVSPDWLAEHMIPEGAHAREMDVTYMFLNRQGESYLSTCCSSSSIDDIDNSNEEGYMLYGIMLYALNLIVVLKEVQQRVHSVYLVCTHMLKL